MLGLEEYYSPSPLGDFNRLFDSQIWVLFKIWHWNVIYVLNGINLAPKMSNLYHCFAGKSKLNAVSTSQSKSKQLAPSNIWTQSTVLSNSSVLVANAVCGEWRWQPQQNLLISVLIPYISASVIGCRSIGSWSSSGLCAGLPITSLRFQLLITLSPFDTACR